MTAPAGHVVETHGAPENPRRYKYYDLVMAAFVTVLLCSNLIGPGKTCILFGITFGAGNLFFPISYIFGDILTEVYGYARARKVIWAGFGAMIFATVMGYIVLAMPTDPKEPFSCLAFKTVTESTGDLIYLRVYSGELHPKDEVFNSTTGKYERVARIFRMMGERRETLEVVGPGEIVAVVGLKNTATLTCGQS